mmetsp:Transcript_14293/g.39033  ORF Transcript_14293/g.39033 Transcript_14293/m.39033 type:complete len:218 (-) Transcript_14293:681-1334(-)
MGDLRLVPDVVGSGPVVRPLLRRLQPGVPEPEVHAVGRDPERRQPPGPHPLHRHQRRILHNVRHLHGHLGHQVLPVPPRQRPALCPHPDGGGASARAAQLRGAHRAGQPALGRRGPRPLRRPVRVLRRPGRRVGVLLAVLPRAAGPQRPLRPAGHGRALQRAHRRLPLLLPLQLRHGLRRAQHHRVAHHGGVRARAQPRGHHCQQLGHQRAVQGPAV